MDRNKRHIPRVIESADSRARQQGRRRLDFSPRQALYYNDHPDAIIEDFDRSEYGAALCEIETHVIQWELQQTPEKADWLGQMRGRRYLSTSEAARAIVETLRR